MTVANVSRATLGFALRTTQDVPFSLPGASVDAVGFAGPTVAMDSVSSLPWTNGPATGPDHGALPEFDTPTLPNGGSSLLSSASNDLTGTNDLFVVSPAGEIRSLSYCPSSSPTRGASASWG